MSARKQAAMNVAEYIHKGQQRWSGEPYHTHCKAVANNALLINEMYGLGLDEDVLYEVGCLHDTLEDQPHRITEEEIRTEFSDVVADAVSLLTKEEDEDYFHYINSISHNKIAIVVKLADLTHNMQSLETVSKRYAKYRIAFTKLNNNLKAILEKEEMFKS